MVLIYAIYLALSLAITVWVGHTLHRNGRRFLLDAFHQDIELADSVNHLLLVGFYLINIGLVALFLRYGDKPGTVDAGIEYISTKVGVVLVVLGAMHFFNIFNFAMIRRRERVAQEAEAGGDRMATRLKAVRP